MKRFFKFLSVLIITVGISHMSPNLHEKFLLKYLGRYSVEILNKTGNFRGSGTLFKDNGRTYIATAAHVCGRVGDNITAVSKFFNENVKILANDILTDTCILESPVDISIFGPKIADNNPYLDNIFYVGYPLVRVPFFGKGYINSELEITTSTDLRPEDNGKCVVGKYFKSRMFIREIERCEFDIKLNYATTPGFSGSSGSAVTNSFGNIVGIVSHGSKQFTNVLMLARLEDIKKLLKSIRE